MFFLYFFVLTGTGRLQNLVWNRSICSRLCFNDWCQVGFGLASASLRFGFGLASASRQLGFCWASGPLRRRCAAALGWASAGFGFGFAAVLGAAPLLGLAWRQLGFSFVLALLRLDFCLASACLRSGPCSASAWLRPGPGSASAWLRLN